MENKKDGFKTIEVIWDNATYKVSYIDNPMTRKFWGEDSPRVKPTPDSYRFVIFDLTDNSKTEEAPTN